MEQQSIKPIDKVSVAKICSGQVIQDLATAVKELVENSLDAGAKHVEVKLKESGLELIEVSDNGSGISPSNYEGLALKYHTSKLSTFSDLSGVTSFGFRGEALSSLCELAGSFTVTTRTKNETVGVKLSFRRDGKLVQKDIAPRQVGTTVRISNMFEPLPVRRGEFQRNIKKQYNRLLRGIQAYALISLGARITLSNTKLKGGKKIEITTQYNSKLDDNVTNVFGPKFLATLVPLRVKFSTEEDQEHHVDVVVSSNHKGSVPAAESTKPKPKPPRVTGSRSKREIWGMVSKAGEGVGRADNDRQFFYVNDRPVDLPKFTRAVNEVWRTYEMKQKPAFILDVRLPAGDFDVNVTPDKREIFMIDEADIIDRMKESLNELWAPSRYTIPTNQGQLVQARLTDRTFMVQSTPTKSSSTPSPNIPPTGSVTSGVLENLAVLQSSSTGEDSTPPVPRSARNRSLKVGAPEQEDRTGDSVHGMTSAIDSPRDVESPRQGEGRRCIAPHEKGNGVSSISSTTQSIHQVSDVAHGAKASVSIVVSHNDHNQHAEKTAGSYHRAGGKGKWCPSEDIAHKEVEKHGTKRRTQGEADGDMAVSHADGIVRRREIRREAEGKGIENIVTEAATDTCNSRGSSINAIGTMGGVAKSSSSSLAFSLPDILAGSQKASRLKRKRDQRNASASSFSGKLSGGASAEDEDSKAAARAFSRVLHKEHFTQMRVVGQFNLGFIICLLGSDLFILDQHACDEKYNFEVLQQTTTIHQQPLVRPLPLETSASEEMTIIDHLSVFEKNGFRFKVNEDQPTTKKLEITAIPFSKGTQFGVDDVHELASIVADSNTKESIRLPKARAMFASRACRSSIMIGKALDRGQMARVVGKMAKIEQPWNCPHGRPTMRHLADVSKSFQAAAGLDAILEG